MNLYMYDIVDNLSVRSESIHIWEIIWISRTRNENLFYSIVIIYFIIYLLFYILYFVIYLLSIIIIFII